MANPAMVSLSLNYVNKKPCFDTNGHSNVKGSTRGEPPTYIELHNGIGGLDGLSNEGIQERLANSLHVPEGMEQDVITKQPGENVLCGVVKGKWIPLNVL